MVYCSQQYCLYYTDVYHNHLIVVIKSLRSSVNNKYLQCVITLHRLAITIKKMWLLKKKVAKKTSLSKGKLSCETWCVIYTVSSVLQIIDKS